MRKIRIINKDGIGHKTEIIDVETGKIISNVRKATIHMEVGCIVTAELEFVLPEMDVVAILEEDDGYILAKEYYVKHSVCPKCERDEVECTTGFIFLSKSDPYRIKEDQNKTSCICGWTGLVHDLVEKNSDS